MHHYQKRKEPEVNRLVIIFLLVVAPVLSICLALLGLETLRTNIMGWFLLILGIAYPAGGAITYFVYHKPFWRSSGTGEAIREESGDRSFWLILPGFLVIFFAAPLEWMYFPEWIPRLPWMQAAGIGFIILALIVRIWARAQLRGQYSGHVEITAGHRLVKSGPYRFLRHPGYTGFVIMTLGVAVSFSSLIGLIAIPALLAPGLSYRMKVEERLLIDQFGDEYREYAGRSKKIIPGVW